MQVLQTPNERFEQLQDFPYQAQYVDVADDVRMHYVDERPAGWQDGGETVLCMHGQPTWSYLYRHMIPLFVAAGYRVIAPDLIGFGKSDKPTQRSDYTYANHVGWVNGLVRTLDLTGLTLVCQDWGGLIGLRVVTDNLDRFARVVTANTGLPDAEGIPDEMAPVMRQMLADTPVLPVLEMAAKLAGGASAPEKTAFLYWIRHCADHADFSPAEVIALSLKSCSDAERAAYAAPFPAEEYLQGARQFPSLVPISPDNPAIADNRAAWKVLRQFDKPFLTAFSDSDPVTAGAHLRFQKEVPGAQKQRHVTIRNAGHFLQEDAGDQLAQAVITFIKNNPV